MSTKTRTIVVTGDVSASTGCCSRPPSERSRRRRLHLDVGRRLHLPRPRRAAAARPRTRRSCALRCHGGLERRDASSARRCPPRRSPRPSIPAYTHTFARIEPFRRRAGVARRRRPGGSPSSWAPIPRARGAGRRWRPGARACRHADDRRPRLGLPRRALPGLQELLDAGPRTIVWQTGAPLGRLTARRHAARRARRHAHRHHLVRRAAQDGRSRSATRSPGNSSPRRSWLPSRPTRSRRRAA